MKQVDSIYFVSFILTVQLCSVSAATGTCSTPDVYLKTETAKNQSENNASNVQHIVENDHRNVYNTSVQRRLQETPQER